MADPVPLTASPRGSLHSLHSYTTAPTPNGTRRDDTGAPADSPAFPKPKRRVTTFDDAHGHPVNPHNPHSPRHHPSGGSSRRSSRARTDPNAGIVRRVTTSLFTPEKPVGKAPGVLESFKVFFLSSWVNVLLVFIPVGWALYFVKKGGNESISDTVVFVMTFIAIIPLAGLLGFATEEVALRLGQTLGGLVNATLGNAVELIVAILALIKCELDVVQSSLIGSILSNLLLVLGCCFFAGGVRFAEQSMKETAGQLNASLLLISVIAVLIPSAFHFSFAKRTDSEGNAIMTDVEKTDLLAMSHGVAILLLFIYCSFMVFQMWTHANLYEDDTKSSSTRHRPEVAAMPGRLRKNMQLRRRKVPDEENPENTETKSDGTAATSAITTSDADAPVAALNDHASETSDDDDEEEVPQMHFITTIVLMVVTVVIVGVTAEFLVDSINGMCEANPSLSKSWVGMILLPVVGNAAEHFTAVSVAVKDKIDLAVSVAVGSSIQVAMFVIPVMELLAWTLNKPMTLMFDPFESIVLFFTVIIVNQTLSDSRTNWMEGLILVFLYLLIAVAFWYYPGSDTAMLLTNNGTC